MLEMIRTYFLSLFLRLICPVHRTQHLLQRLGCTTKQIWSAESPVLPGGGEMRLEREEAIVAVLAQALQEFRPVSYALCRGHNTAIRKGIFYMYIALPPMQCLVSVRISSLSTLDEVGGVKYSLEMWIVDALHQVNTTSDSIAVDIFLVLVQQGNTRCVCPRGQLAQAPEHFGSPFSRVGRACGTLGWIEGKDAYKRRLEKLSQFDCTLETL